ESYTMADADDGWPAEVPEKRIGKVFDATKFLLDLVSGGAVAAMAKTAAVPISGNLASVVRYAPTLGLNIAFKEQYRNHYAQYREKNESFWKFLKGNLSMGAMAGGTTLLIVHPIENVLPRAKERNPRLRADRVRLVDIISKGYKGFFGALPSAVFYNGFYFGLYDSLKVVVTSGDQKLDFFSAWALALV
ncbi:hypothetical protein PMAYCL1PPCAC_20593, partial [Pristionchus mayeri]